MHVLDLILGGGGVAFLACLYQGAKMFRDGTDKRITRDMANLEKRIAEAREDADFYQEEADYWRTRAGRLEYVVLKHGLQNEVPPPPPLPERPQTPRETGK